MATKVLLTLAEYEALPEDNTKQRELSEGELVEVMWPKSEHSLITRTLFRELDQYLRSVSLGLEAVIETAFLLQHEPPTLRAPDVGVATTKLIQSAGANEWFDGAPVLAVEVVSPTNDPEDLAIKTRQYFRAGTGEVWIVYPKARSVQAYLADGSARVYTDGMLPSTVITGFAVEVASIFRRTLDLLPGGKLPLPI